jgi:potassium efflux system protein
MFPLKNYLLIFLLAFSFQLASAQKKTRIKLPKDTLTDVQTPNLVSKIEHYNFIIDRNSFLLKRNYDLSKIETEVPPIEKGITGFKNKFNSLSKNMNIRSLNSGVILLGEVSEKLEKYQEILDGYQKSLNQSNVELDDIVKDKDFNVNVNDSILHAQVNELLDEAKDLKYEQKKILASVNLWSSKVSVSVLQTKDLASDMRYLGISKKMNMFSQEEPKLFSIPAGSYKNNLVDVTAEAISRSGKIILIYLSSKVGILVFSILVFVGITTLFAFNIKRVKKKDNKEVILEQTDVLTRSSVLASLVCFFTYMPFFFANPPMSFLHTCEFLRLIVLYFLIAPFINKPFKWVWLVLNLIWIFYAIDDLLLESALGERWGLFIVGLIFGGFVFQLIRAKKNFFREIQESPVAKALLIFVLIQIVLSVLFNLFGRLTLSKTFGVSAIQCLMFGIVLKIFCQIVIEAIYIQSESFQSSKMSQFINFVEVQHRIQRNLWIIAGVVFFVSLVRNLGFYDLFTNVTSSFFYEQRAIGSYKFTLASVAIFFVILWVSSLISGFINFFFGYDKTISGGKRSGLNSMMLLIRLAIWTIGFLIAIAAAGIPLDRVSIMLGALGVGIGFGLQNIINNLVSGVIIAFERPIQIGDQIEIGNKAGLVKEIGVRSSKIHSADGADIIVPNGDLLSQHLINWTMQDRRKRIEYIIGVPYDSDLDLVRKVIAEELAKNKNISEGAAPGINVNDFGENSVRLKIHIWVDDLSLANEARTTAMIGTKNALASVGIVMETAI